MGDDSHCESPQSDAKRNRTKVPSDWSATPVQHRIHSLNRLHHNFGKRESLLEENVETVRRQVRECFQRCREKLNERERLLLLQINDEHRKLKRALVAPKRMAMVNNEYLNLNMEAILAGDIKGEDGSSLADPSFLIRQGHNRNAHNNKGNESQVPLNNNEDGDPIIGAIDKPGQDESSDSTSPLRTSPRGSPQRRKSGSGSPSRTSPRGSINGSNREVETLQTVLKQTETKQLHFTRANDSILSQYDQIVSQLGLVYMGNADPTRTLITCYPALVLAESVARIKGITKDGQECTTGGSNVHAVLRSSNGVATTCEVTDCQNGTYKMTYTPPSVGIHELHVSISGQPVRGSPFEVDVKPVRLHVNKAFLGGPCTVAIEMPRDYKMPIERNGKPNGTRKLSLQSIQVVILDPDGKEIAGSMLGAVKRKGIICTYTAKYTPLVEGDHEIIISWVGQTSPISQQVIPVHKKEQIGNRGCRQGQFINPTDVLVAGNGDIFVADTVENRRIQVLSPDGKFKMQFYVPLQEPALMGANEMVLAVLFLNTNTVMVFNHKGSIISQFVPEQLIQPYGIAVDSKNQIHINDRALHTMFIFDTIGTLTKQVGSYGSGPGQFDYPNYICIDLDNHVYISEAKNNRIQELDAYGAYNREFRSDKLQQPGAIVTTDSGYLLIHNEFDSKVHIMNLDDATFQGCIDVDLIAVYTRRIAVTKNGFLLALDMTNHSLWRYRIPYK